MIGDYKFVISKNNQKGSILIGIIVAMVLFAALGTAILSLTSTATMNQVMANSAARAYYLAESGFRYAYYHRENGNDLESTLELLHDETLTLNYNDGSSHLKVYPYYLEVTENPKETMTLQTKFPGGCPENFTSTDETNKVQIRSESCGYDSIDDSIDVSFIRSTGNTFPSISIGTDVLFMAMAKEGDSQTVTAGGSLDLKAMTGLQFPQRNGIVEIDGHICSYREYNHDNNSLTGIKIHDDNPQDFTVGAEQEIILQKFAKVESTGTFGTGDHQSVRKIVYYVPFPIKDRGKKVEFHEEFDDGLSHWDSVLGSHEIQDIDGNALKVTGTGTVGVSDSGSLIIFKWKTETETVIDFESSHEYAGKYLSYDAQVKIGFNAQVSYMAGISFRLVASNGASDSFGISFLKSKAPLTDKIPDGLLPLDANGAIVTAPSIVLWQNIGGDRKWLAYKKLNGDPNFATDATILVRIIEAALIEFTDGGPDPVKDGDIVIYKESNGKYVKGRVVGSPILDLNSPPWVSGHTTGRILLNNITGQLTFSDQIINVEVSNTTMKINAYRPKDNYIRAYYGTSNGSTSNLGTPLDYNRLAYPRNADIQWPPDNREDWSADNDYFTLVQWDPNSSVTPLESVDEPDAIIRSDSLITDSFSSTKPEIGLHTFGRNSTSIYFDDFAMQAIIEADAIILPVVQE